MKKSYPLRIDDELYLKLQRIADENSRSINKEMEFMIKQYVTRFEDERGKIAVQTDALYQ